MIIVGTHWDLVPRDQRGEKETKWKEMIDTLYTSKRQKSRDYPNIAGMYFVGSRNLGIENLIEGIYDIATDMESPEGTVLHQCTCTCVLYVCIVVHVCMVHVCIVHVCIVHVCIVHVCIVHVCVTV